MKLEQAKALGHGDILHCTFNEPCTETKGPRGSVTVKTMKVKVNGEVQTWKKEPFRVKVPIKHGLRTFGYITETNLDDFHLEEDCPLLTAAVDQLTETYLNVHIQAQNTVPMECPPEFIQLQDSCLPAED